MTRRRLFAHPSPRQPFLGLVLLVLLACSIPGPTVEAAETGGLLSAAGGASGGAFAEDWHGELFSLRFIEADRPVTSADALLESRWLGAVTPLFLAGIHDDQSAGAQSVHAGLGAAWESLGYAFSIKTAYLRNRNDQVTRDNDEGWIGRIETSRSRFEAILEGVMLWGVLSRTQRVGTALDIDIGRRGDRKIGYLNARFDYEWSDPGGPGAIEVGGRAAAWGLAGAATLRNSIEQGIEWLEIDAAYDLWEGESPPFRPPTLAEHFARLARLRPAPTPIFLLTSEQIEERAPDSRRIRWITAGARWSRNFLLDDEVLSFFAAVHLTRERLPFLEVSGEYSEEVRAESFFEGIERRYGAGVGLFLRRPLEAVLFAQYRSRGEAGSIAAGAGDAFFLALSVPLWG